MKKVKESSNTDPSDQSATVAIVFSRNPLVPPISSNRDARYRTLGLALAAAR